jgi:hypothetical protein
LPEGVREAGHPPQAANRGVKDSGPLLDCRQHVCQGAPGVMKVQCERGFAQNRPDSSNHFAHRHRVGHPRRISERHLPDSHRHILDHDFFDLFRRHGAFVLAAKGGRNVSAHNHSPAKRGLAHAAKSAQRIADRHCDVFLIMGFGGGDKERHLVHSGSNRPLQPPVIWRQGRIPGPRPSSQPCRHLLGISQLWNGLGAYKRGNFDSLQSGIGEALYQCNFFIGGNKARLALQAVPGAHLHYGDRLRKIHPPSLLPNPAQYVADNF